MIDHAGITIKCVTQEERLQRARMSQAEIAALVAADPSILINHVSHQSLGAQPCYFNFISVRFRGRWVYHQRQTLEVLDAIANSCAAKPWETMLLITQWFVFLFVTVVRFLVFFCSGLCCVAEI